MQKISIIVAFARNRAIGKNGAIPWHLSADLVRFKNITLGHTVVMGRKTYESIGKPLLHRRNIVITRQKDYSAPGCEILGSLEEALARTGGGEVFVIGGAEVYREALPLAHRIYATAIDVEFPADAYFPEIDGRAWRKVSEVRGIQDEKNPYEYTFLVFERNS